ncbi:MAG TPA: hypothetical protein VLS45_08580, partial [Methylomicrobium sp.]|nr:hypothetical protein [Methylomicrobium sp.]
MTGKLTYGNRGLAHYHLKKFKQVIKDTDEFLKLEKEITSEHALSYAYRGGAYLNLGNPRRAL